MFQFWNDVDELDARWNFGAAADIDALARAQVMADVCLPAYRWLTIDRAQGIDALVTSSARLLVDLLSR